MPQPLTSKESSLFRQVIKFYESKQNKKGLKAAEQILRKNPNHGDTLAMKALIINAQGKTEEAFILSKEALKNDMKSHVCWHVYGLLYRHVKNFEEAIKAYKFALKLEPDSQQIQRDLALLQIQMRDYQGYMASRTSMLKARPHLRQNWTALAIAHHLGGNLSEAESVLSTYEDTLKSPPPKTDVEHSEAVLYKNTIIAEQGNFEKALDHLDAAAKHNLDRVAVMEMKAEYLLKLGRKKESAKLYRALVDRNSDRRSYYQSLEEALELDPDDMKARKAIYEEYAKKNPRSDAPRWIPLGFLEGDEFKEAADIYLRQMLTKGVPSTFANVKALYLNESKKEIIRDLVASYTLEDITPDDVSSTKGQDKPNGHPSKFEHSVQYFLAQHYNYFRSRNLAQALVHIDRALALSPESVDYHMTKARIWKHYGDLAKAAELMEHARTVDERDRYINTKAAKYQLRADENEKALQTMSKFTRNETAGGPLGDLHDMQCLWYINEDGQSYLRQEKLGLALKRFTAVFDIYEQWQEDQFDFHNFSLRKGQIRAYIQMIRWEDRLRNDQFFSRSAIGAAKAYILLHDKPELASENHKNDVNGQPKDLDGLDGVEKKKALKKARKEQQKQEKAEADKKAEKKASKPVPEGETKKEDVDPKGLKLVQTSEPLVDVMKFLGPLLEFNSSNIEAQAIGFEVFLRRKKYLLCYRCIVAAKKIDPEDPTLHKQIIRFHLATNTSPSPSTPFLDKLAPIIPTEITSTEYNTAFRDAHPTSAPHIIAALASGLILDPSTAKSPDVEKETLQILDLPEVRLEDARSTMKWLKEENLGFKDEFERRARHKWKEAAWGGEKRDEDS